MNLDTLNRSELLNEIMELAREQGVNSENSWKELVDEVVASHLDLGEMDDDQDIAVIQEALYGEWGTYRSESGEETLDASSEDPRAPHE